MIFDYLYTMPAHVLHIKNMVCERCISAVKQIAVKEKLAFTEVRLGEIELKAKIPDKAAKEFDEALRQQGFELISNRNGQVIDRIKKVVLAYLEELEEKGRVNLSEKISSVLPYDYTYLSHLFSSIEGITIEQYFILQRIEKAKEYLVYGEWTLSEIAYKLGYSSVHHLSAQFKKVTGLTPSHFKKIGAGKRKTLDKL